MVTAGTAPPLRFISYNICGNFCGSAPYDNQVRIDSVVAQAAATAWNADHISLQEVCRHQFNSVLDRLKGLGFQGFFSRTVLATPGVCGNADYGNAVFVRGQISQTLDMDLTVGGEREPIRVPCVKHTIQYRTAWSCSVHLYWDDGTLAVFEAKELAAQAQSWLAQGIPVVLVGDFNHSPRSATLSEFYDRSLQDGSVGDFFESDQTDQDFFDPDACVPGITPACRSGEITMPLVSNKSDYVFVSSTHHKNPQADVRPLDTAASDHRMVRAAAAWADCGATDPLLGTLFRRNASGALFRTTGTTGGTLSAACKTGTGWNGMRHVVRLPQTSILAAVDTAGELWHYRADSNGAYSGSTRIRAATGWQTYNRVLAPGDLTGDGVSDLITRDNAGVLWRHVGRVGNNSYAAPVRVGGGWQIYTILTASGDFSGDGRADLLARDAAGVLWLYRGNGAGGFAPRAQIGTAWNIYNQLVMPGDLDRDGRVDLLGRDNSGVLWFYRAEGNGGYRPRSRLTDGYPAGELLF